MRRRPTRELIREPLRNGRAIEVNQRESFHLSILILTLPSRIERFLPRLIQKLNSQAVGKQVQILYLGDNRSMTVGEKRNDLMMMARGKYVAFLDDDDDISGDYIDSFLEKMGSDPDAICLKAQKTEIRKGNRITTPMEFSRYNGKNHREGGILKMIPGHICGIRRTIAIQYPFPAKNLSEDHEWAEMILPKIEREEQISKVTYFYNFDEEITETRWT